MVSARPPYFISEMSPPRLHTPSPQRAKGSEGSLGKLSIDPQLMRQYRLAA